MANTHPVAFAHTHCIFHLSICLCLIQCNAMYDVNIIIQTFLFSHYKWQCIVFRLCFVLRFQNTTIFNNCNQIMCKHLTRLLNTHRSTQPTSHACLYFMYSKQSHLFIIVTHESIHLRLKGVVFPSFRMQITATKIKLCVRKW